MVAADEEAVLNALLPPVLTGMRILDVGCGTGTWALSLAARGAGLFPLKYMQSGEGHEDYSPKLRKGRLEVAAKKSSHFPQIFSTPPWYIKIKLHRERGVFSMMWGWGGGWPFMWFWGLLMWLIPAAIIGLIIWALAAPRRPHGYHDPGPNSPLDTLKVRLAKGEITVEEYNRMKEFLK